MKNKFNQMISNHEIHDICKKYDIENYTINPDDSISVDGNVYLGNRSLKRMPLVFKEVSGYFICHGNELISLEGCPGKVGGDFFCSNNRLKSLEGCPGKVGGDFYCSNNRLKSLEGCPKEIPDDFYCEGNQLTSLEGGPEKIGGGFNCSSNKLTTLKGCPGIVGGNFNCGFNQLTSLEGCPRARVIYCYNNKITIFDDLPEFWEDYIVITKNPVDEIYKLFKRDPKCIEWIREYDVIQGDKVSKHRLEEVFHTLNLEVPKDIKLKNYKLYPWYEEC